MTPMPHDQDEFRIWQAANAARKYMANGGHRLHPVLVDKLPEDNAALSAMRVGVLQWMHANGDEQAALVLLSLGFKTGKWTAEEDGANIRADIDAVKALLASDGAT